MSKIEWTDTTWSPVTGCTQITPGCANCYAKTMSHRLKAMGRDKYRNAFELTLHPECLGEPLRWKKPRMCFVCSMSDLFHEDVPNEFIAAVFGVCAACPDSTFQILTKRAERLPAFFEWYLAQATTWIWGSEAGHNMGVTNTWMHRYGIWAPARLKRAPSEPLENVWFGVSVENRKHGLPRIEHLRRTPAAVRFLSMEPLIEDPGDDWSLDDIDWVIIGGESGHGVRPMHPDWVRRIRDKVLGARVECSDCLGDGCLDGQGVMCTACRGRGFQGPALFFKQWGAWGPTGPLQVRHGALSRRGDFVQDGQFPQGASSADGWQQLYCVGKGKAGRELDGRTWDEMPARLA